MENLKQIIFRISKITLKTTSYILGLIILLLIISASSITVWDTLKGYTNEEDSEPCNTAVILIEGDIVTHKSASPETFTDEAVANDILKQLDIAEQDPDIKAVILSIDSSGGSVVASQEIANQIIRMTKPSVAVIRDGGLSGAYWIATGTNHIIASSLSNVGSIGVVWGIYNQVEKNKKDGYDYIQISSGKYKAAINPSLPMTKDLKDKLYKEILQNYDIFVDAVSENRGIKREDVLKLADGRRFTGTDAVKNGLVDELGDMFTAKEYLTEVMKTEVRVCK